MEDHFQCVELLKIELEMEINSFAPLNFSRKQVHTWIINRDMLEDAV